MLTHPTGLFRETISRPLGVLAPQIFTHVTPPKMYFKSDIGRRAASCWALPHISSLSCALRIIDEDVTEAAYNSVTGS